MLSINLRFETEEATVGLAGMTRSQHQTSVRWTDDTDFSCSPGLMVQPCGGGWPPTIRTHRGLLEVERGLA